MQLIYSKRTFAIGAAIWNGQCNGLYYAQRWLEYRNSRHSWRNLEDTRRVFTACVQ